MAEDLGKKYARIWWAVLTLCVILLIGVLIVDILHRVAWTKNMWPSLRHYWFNSDADSSMSEMFGYVQALVAHGALLYLGVKLRGAWTHIVLGQAMLIIFLDDYLRLHETTRTTLIDLANIEGVFGLRPEDIGELLAWVTIGTPILILLVIAWKNSNSIARHQAKRLLVGLAILMFFAVVIDMVGIAVGQFGIEAGAYGWQGRAFYILTLIESLGELGGISIVMLIALYYLFQQFHKNQNLVETGLSHPGAISSNDVDE